MCTQIHTGTGYRTDSLNPSLKTPVASTGEVKGFRGRTDLDRHPRRSLRRVTQTTLGLGNEEDEYYRNRNNRAPLGKSTLWNAPWGRWTLYSDYLRLDETNLTTHRPPDTPSGLGEAKEKQ